MLKNKVKICGKEAVINGLCGAMRVKCELEKGHSSVHKESGINKKTKKRWCILFSA